MFISVTLSIPGEAQYKIHDTMYFVVDPEGIEPSSKTL